MKPAILFDLDNTVIDSTKAFRMGAKAVDNYAKRYLGILHFGKAFDQAENEMVKIARKRKDVI